MYRHVSKEDAQVANNHTQSAHHHYSLGSCKATLQWNITSPNQMATIKRTENNECGRGRRETGTLIPCWWECKMLRPLWKAVWQPLQWPGSPTHRYGPNMNENISTQKLVHRNSSIVHHSWKVSVHWSMDKQTVVYPHTVEYHSAVKRNEVLVHAPGWMNLENILLNERSQSQKTTYYMPLICNVLNRQIRRGRKEISGCQGLGEGDA